MFTAPFIKVYTLKKRFQRAKKCSRAGVAAVLHKVSSSKSVNLIS